MLMADLCNIPTHQRPLAGVYALNRNVLPSLTRIEGVVLLHSAKNIYNVNSLAFLPGNASADSIH